MPDKEKLNAREKSELAESFIRGNNLSEDLQQEIRNYLHTVDTGRSMDQSDVLSLLSRNLQLQVASFNCRQYLQGLELLKGTSDYLQDSLCVLLREVVFAPGQWLFFEAACASCFSPLSPSLSATLRRLVPAREGHPRES